MIQYKCCKNVGVDKFQACGKPAKTFYKHDEDICSYCEEHDYCCGEPIIISE
jgi:hypothetical protein